MESEVCRRRERIGGRRHCWICRREVRRMMASTEDEDRKCIYKLEDDQECDGEEETHEKEEDRQVSGISRHIQVLWECQGERREMFLYVTDVRLMTSDDRKEYFKRNANEIQSCS